MKDEIKTRLSILQEKLDNSEPGSVQHDHWMSVKRELEAKLAEIEGKKPALHVAEDSVCDACQ